jgi:hypothetical protein
MQITSNSHKQYLHGLTFGLCLLHTSLLGPWEVGDGNDEEGVATKELEMTT